MGGGIIINRSEKLKQTLNDPSFYEFLSETDKDAMEVINAKAPGQITESDIRWMAERIVEVTCG